MGSLRVRLNAHFSVTAFLALFIAAPAFALQVNVALTPSAAQVAGGTTFQVRLDVTQLGAEFNTYEAYVEYDPAMLTFLPTSPLTLQEGAHMTSACNNTFHVFQVQSNVLHITHSLLCADTYRTGPGNLYILNFRANNTAGTTQVQFASIGFYRGGPSVELGAATDATIQVTTTTDVATPDAGRMRLLVAPNPFNPTAMLSIETSQAGFQRVLVHDPRGRLVQVLGAGHFPAGSRRIVWSAREANLPSGSYLITLETEHGKRTARALLVK